MRIKLLLLLSLMPFVIGSSALAATMMTVYCPKASDLKKDSIKLTWSADRSQFRSYDISFANSIDQFTGAQWIGANVGQVTCIYKTFPKTAFPILLIFHTLVFEPKGHDWTKNLGGYKNCNSLHRKQCPFEIQIKHKQKNIYQEAESLKSTNPEPPAD